jgi:hypothetical protein
MHPDELDAEEDVEEVLVLRVVSAAQRRRLRRLVVGGLLVIVAGGGVAIGMTHRSGAMPIARPTTPAVTRAVDDATRAEIYAVARARYRSGLDGAQRRAGRTHVEFGRLTVIGNRARLPVNFVCVPLCGHGEEITLAKLAGSWRVVAVRKTWWS